MESFVEQFKKEISGFAPTRERERTGTVVKVGDGVAEIEGLTGAVMSEMIRFDLSAKKSLEGAISSAREVYGVVLNLEEDLVRAIVLGDAGLISEGTVAVSTGEILSIGVGDALLGRVVSPLGEPVDALGTIAATKKNPIEREAYGVMQRQAVNTPLHTGIKAIDSMIPIGRGQRELIIGDLQCGKTAIASDTIINQKKEKPVIWIHVVTAQKQSIVATIVEYLRKSAAMHYTIVV